MTIPILSDQSFDSENQKAQGEKKKESEVSFN